MTEQFVRNGLTAANRDLGADFAQERFAFDALWDAEREWMDIGFNGASRRIPSTSPSSRSSFALAEGERLRVEVSSKFRREGIEAEVVAAGLRPTGWWTDHAGGFALVLATA